MGKRSKKSEDQKINTNDTNNDIDVYVVECKYFQKSNYNTHIYIMKTEELAKAKIEELHDENCDRDTFDTEHTTYAEHDDIETLNGEDEMHLSLSYKKRRLYLSNDEIISFSSYS